MKANKFEKLQEFEILNIGMMDAVQGGFLGCDPRYAGDSCGTNDEYCFNWLPANSIPRLEGLAHDGYCTSSDAGKKHFIDSPINRGTMLPKDDRPLYAVEAPYCNDVLHHDGISTYIG